MKKLVVLLMAMLVATSAVAIVDSGDNSMGFYFDMDADVYCTTMAQNEMAPLYIVATNMVADAIWGVEFGYTIDGNALVVGTAFDNPSIIDVGAGVQNHIVGFGAPSMTSPVTLLATLNIMNLGTEAVGFTMHGSTPSSMDPAYPVILLADGVILSAGLSAESGYAAQINGDCMVVATDNVSFDGIKSLYR